MVVNESRTHRSPLKATTALALAVAVLALAGCDANAVVTPTASGVPTTEFPTLSPTNGPDVTALIPGGSPGAFDDGIAEEELPALAPRRAADYPEAHLMLDWVWDRVDAQWALALYGNSVADPAAGTYVYLISPEGVSFELMRVPDAYASDAQLRSWREAEGTAMILFDQSTGWHHTAWGGVELNLRTGATDTVRIKIGNQTSMTEDLRAVADDGTELWLAEAGAETRYLIWSPTTGWRTIARELGDVSLPEIGGTLSPDAGTVLFYSDSAMDSDPASSDSWLVIYGLDPDGVVAQGDGPSFPGGYDGCYVDSWIDASTLGAACYAAGAPEDEDYWHVPLRSAEPPEMVPNPQDAYDANYAAASFSFDGVPFQFVSEERASNVFEVRFVGPDGAQARILSTEDFLLRSGFYVKDAPVEVAPGAFRIVGGSGTYSKEVFGFDANTGFLTQYIPGRFLDTGYAPAAHSLIFFGEHRAEFWAPNLGG